MYMALVALTHRYIHRMRANKSGTIINVSSTASFQPLPYMATYAATKAFVTSFSEAIAEENREHGIRVLNLCPGGTETNFFAAAGIDRPFNLKGMQTAEQVVDAALDALVAGKTTKISGTLNWLIAKAATFSPNWLVTRAVASKLRPAALEKAAVEPNIPDEKKTKTKGAGS